MIRFICLFILFVSQISVANQAHSNILKIDLITTTNLNLREFHRVEMKDSKFIIDGVMLAPDLLPLAVQDLKNLKSLRRITPSSCEAGVFRHTVLQGNNENHEDGCLQSNSYLSILTSFHHLQKLASLSQK